MKIVAVEGFGGDTTAASYGQPGDATHLAVPVAIIADTAEEAVARAMLAGKAISDALDALPFVRPITTGTEAAYALLANATSALQQLPMHELAIVVAASPVRQQLLDLLRPWVCDLPDGRIAVAGSGPGEYDIGHDTIINVTARRATDEDLERIEREAQEAGG